MCVLLAFKMKKEVVSKSKTSRCRHKFNYESRIPETKAAMTVRGKNIKLNLCKSKYI